MLKLQWAVLFGLSVYAFQAGAEQSIVIDAEMLSTMPGATTEQQVSPSAVEVMPIDPQAEANRERILKGGKMSARQKREIAKAEQADSNKQMGVDFLSNNSMKQGVTSLPSGVQYKILRAGQGRKPTDNSVVTCRIRGTLVDGRQFETDGGKNTSLKVNGMLPGLKEAVKLMSAGAKWEIVIPPQLAYGERGDRGIGPNAVLIYRMEIVRIN